MRRCYVEKMIKIIVEISEVKTEPDATNIAFRIEKEHPTEIEQFWESRVSPVLKDVLTRPGLLGDL